MTERSMHDTAVRSRSSDILPTAHSANASPARGRETRTALLQKLRPPTLVHAWDFWYEKPRAYDDGQASLSTTPPTSTNDAATTANASASFHVTDPTKLQTLPTAHGTLLTPLHSMTDLKHFWALFNNFSFASLQPHTSVHLFHSTVTPTWEDTRNAAGGSWTFRIPRESSPAVFQQLALLAIGEKLQEAVYEEGKTVFKDDLCGVSLSVKGADKCAISVWHRDAGNEVGKQRLREVVLGGCEVSDEHKNVYYKRHGECMGFRAGAAQSEEPLRPKPLGLVAAQEIGREVVESTRNDGQALGASIWAARDT